MTANKGTKRRTVRSKSAPQGIQTHKRRTGQTDEDARGRNDPADQQPQTPEGSLAQPTNNSPTVPARVTPTGAPESPPLGGNDMPFRYKMAVVEQSSPQVFRANVKLLTINHLWQCAKYIDYEGVSGTKVKTFFQEQLRMEPQSFQNEWRTIRSLVSSILRNQRAYVVQLMKKDYYGKLPRVKPNQCIPCRLPHDSTLTARDQSF